MQGQGDGDADGTILVRVLSITVHVGLVNATVSTKLSGSRSRQMRCRIAVQY